LGIGQNKIESAKSTMIAQKRIKGKRERIKFESIKEEQLCRYI